MHLSYFSIRSQQFGEVTYSKDIPNHLTDHLLPFADATVGYSESGCILFQQINGEDYAAFYTTILLNRDDQLLISLKEPLIILTFALQASFEFVNINTPEQLIFNEGEYNISLLSSPKFSVNFTKDCTYRCLTIAYAHDRLLSITSEYSLMRKLLDQSSLGNLGRLNPNNKLLTGNIKQSISEFLFCPCKSGEVYKVIQRGKIWELLVQILEQSDKHSTVVPSVLNQSDAEKIRAAKEYLDHHHDTPITLLELARQVGINVHKLSTGFLQIIGFTIFNYHRQVRMSKAMELLEQTDRDLFDIGTEIGYVDGKCFSKEFKKVKGLSPIEYRRKIRAGYR